MIRKFKFYIDNKESEIYEYNTDDFYNTDDLFFQIEDDRNEWMYQIINTGYIEIKHDKQCTNCDWTGFEEDLIEYNETSKVDNITLEYFKGCPNCKTDEYLMDI